MNRPRILLLKCHNATFFSLISPIITEPLELEYIAAVLDQMPVDYCLHDSLLERCSSKEMIRSFMPDILLLSGYIVAVERIKKLACFGKKLNACMVTIVGGVHAEINQEDFYDSSIDVVVHSNSLIAIERLMHVHCDPQAMESIPGIAFKKGGRWESTEKEISAPNHQLVANRSYFELHKHQTHYLNYSPVALVKTALSCPNSCTFCYCRLLNKGIYSARPIVPVVTEIAAIQSETIWIVDDTFLLDRLRIQTFIDLISFRGIKKHFILYSRVDFIACNEDLIKQLAGIGLVEVIVGMESVSDQKLSAFHKNIYAQDNSRASEILKRHGVNLTALFIADIDFTHHDFKQLRKWLKTIQPENYTLSIATPLKGTHLYAESQEAIIEHRFSKFDFLHLTMKPLHMSKLAFYVEVYRIYVELILQSKSVRTLLMSKLFGQRRKA